MFSARAQQPAPPGRVQPPGPDIFLVPLRREDGVPVLGTPANATDRAGYDNQPYFVADGSAILFTSVREDAQADVYRLDIATRSAVRVTSSAPESEYSPTPIDGGRAIAVVRVERDSTQRLWRFPSSGGEPTVILPDLRPVGYQAWIDEHTVAVFVLGSPNSLQLADTRTQRADTITTAIGRSLHRIPGTRRVGFVHKLSAAEWWIKSLDVDTRRVRSLVQLPEGVEDHAWLPDGSVLAGNESAILWWSGREGEGWRQVADLAPAGVRGITRLAVSPAGDRLALVAEGRSESRPRP